jgi:hypothetical protein
MILLELERRGALDRRPIMTLGGAPRAGEDLARRDRDYATACHDHGKALVSSPCMIAIAGPTILVTL